MEDIALSILHRGCPAGLSVEMTWHSELYVLVMMTTYERTNLEDARMDSRAEERKSHPSALPAALRAQIAAVGSSTL